jgi:hypothetical protein
MSDTTGHEQQQDLQNEAIAEGHNVQLSEIQPDEAKDAVQGELRLESGAKDEHVVKSIDTQLVGGDGTAEQEGSFTRAMDEDVGKSQEVRSPLAEGIEKEASEHLARRAAEMSMAGDDTSNQESSATLKDEELPASPPAPPVPDKDAPLSEKEPEQEPEYDEKHPPPADEQTNDLPEPRQDTTEATGAEIQNIMEQFKNGLGGASEEIMSPILERQQPILVLPPRTSSLEHREQHSLTPQTTGGSTRSQPFSSPHGGKAPSISGASLSHVNSDDTESISSVKTGSIFQPPPPSPDPDPPLPFDFHRFLEQLRHRTADPVARFLRSFLTEFGKKQWMVHEQVKIISDFLEFISKKMAQCEVWRTVSDAEFDNAREGMEKLVMNRLYSQTFSPAIPPVAGSPRKSGSKSGRSAADAANPHGPGRRGQHQEDIERDEVIALKMELYGWIQEEHLEIEPINEKGRKFLTLAQKELLKINTYRAPRDKVICVLNACKVIFGFLKNSKGDQSADAFIPLLIYTVLRARPEHLVSNVQYIWRFRNQDKLGGEAGYYMSSLMGVVTFIEGIDRNTIKISQEDFDRNVEQAVSAIAEKNKADEYEEKSHAAANSAPPLQQRLAEKSGLSRAEVTPKNSMDAEQSSPRRQTSGRKSNHAHQSSTDTVDDFDAVTGLLRTIQKPLSSIGRIFSDDGGGAQQQSQTLRPASTPLPGSRSASPALPERRPSADGRRRDQSAAQRQNADDAAARQASAETAQAHRVRAQEYKVVVE